jgi:hypothetical protein
MPDRNAQTPDDFTGVSAGAWEQDGEAAPADMPAGGALAPELTSTLKLIKDQRID